jgi:hypothetical protein
MILDVNETCTAAAAAASRAALRHASRFRSSPNEDRKRKSMIASLQQQNKLKLAEQKAETAAIDKMIGSLEPGYLPK